MGRPQTMVELTIAGKGLTPYLGYPVVICQSLAAGGHATGEYIRVDLVADTAQNNDTKLSGIISIFPTAPSGTYEVFLTDSSGTKLFDIGQKFTVRSPNDGAYADCPTKSGPVAGDKDLFCSQALLDYHQTREIFGKGVADRYIVAQVTVRNLSDDFEYVLHDIRLGTTQAVVASIDRKLVRGLAQKTEQFSARAIALRLTEAGATMLTGISGVVGNELLKDAANLTAGPAILGLKHAIPDLTVQESNRIDDLGFSANAIVVSKHAATPLVVFLSSDIFSATKFRDLEQPELMTFQQNLIVQVAGAHVMEVKQPTVASINTSTMDLSKLAKGDSQTFTLTGTALDSVTAVHLTPEGGGAAVTVVPEKNTDPTKAQFKIKESDVAAGKYSVTVDTATKKNISTPASIDVTNAGASPAPPEVTSVTGSPVSLAALTKQKSLDLTLVGSRLDSVATVTLRPKEGTPGKPRDLIPEKPVDASKLTVKLTDTPLPPEGKYSVILVAADKTETVTTAEVVVGK